MHYLALHEDQLAYFSYHWFFGLSFNKYRTRNSIWHEIRYLEADVEERNRIITQIKNSAHWSWLLMTLCWIFNINNYRVNYYRLHSYISFQIYKD